MNSGLRERLAVAETKVDNLNNSIVKLEENIMHRIDQHKDFAEARFTKQDQRIEEMFSTLSFLFFLKRHPAIAKFLCTLFIFNMFLILGMPFKEIILLFLKKYL